MVVIRFQRRGTKKTPHHRIVVTEHTRAQSGNVIEVVGVYNPAKEPAMLSVKEDRLAYWISNGAKMSEALARVLRSRLKTALPVR